MVSSFTDVGEGFKGFCQVADADAARFAFVN